MHHQKTRGEHIHHGYFISPTDTKEKAQIQLIELLLERSHLPARSTVLDVGCGIGGTSRHLAQHHGCTVVGLTISGRQVEIARRLTLEAAAAAASAGDPPITKKTPDPSPTTTTTSLSNGSVRFIELDAEAMGEFFSHEPEQATFDGVWISEAMSHLPDKALFFRNAARLLNRGGKLVVADWFKAEGLTEAQLEAEIKPIEGERERERERKAQKS